jgi:DNA-binding protein HU-beta
MTKAQLITNIAKEARISKSLAESVINLFTASVKRALKKGDKLTLPGFGTFSLAKRRARIGRNPKTGEELKIPARKVARFKAGKLLRNAVK